MAGAKGLRKPNRYNLVSELQFSSLLHVPFLYEVRMYRHIAPQFISVMNQNNDSAREIFRPSVRKFKLRAKPPAKLPTGIVAVPIPVGNFAALLFRNCNIYFGSSGFAVPISMPKMALISGLQHAQSLV